jgi:hypothetical protein
MNPFDLLEKLVTEHGSAAVLREHIGLLRAQAEQVDKEKEVLQQENARLVAENCDLRAQVSRHLTSSQYLVWHGVLIKRTEPDGYVDVPYCPKCKEVLSAPGRMAPYLCTTVGCEFVSGVRHGAFDAKLNELRGVV